MNGKNECFWSNSKLKIEVVLVTYDCVIHWPKLTDLKSVNCSVMSDSATPLEPTRLLCPQDFPGKNTGTYYPILVAILPGGSSSGVSRVIRSGDGVGVLGKNYLIRNIKRLGKNSVVGKFSGEKRLNNLVYVEN